MSRFKELALTGLFTTGTLLSNGVLPVEAEEDIVMKVLINIVLSQRKLIKT